MALNSYSTGTISIGANATAVVGVGTLWNEANARAGDTLIVAGHQVLIEDNTDATHLVIDAWPFSAVAGGTAYKIVHTSPLRFAGAQAMIDVDNLVSALDTDGYVVVVKATETVPNPSYGNENQFAFQWGTGKLWTKSGGVWVFVGLFKGFTPKGSWSGATAYVVGDIVTSAGSSYLCVADHTNHLPPNVTYWQLLSSIGASGASGVGYGGTSTTSLAIGTGSKVFTTQAGLAYVVGSRARAVFDAANWMEGPITAYTGTSLTITVDKTLGSGTRASWSFNVSGEIGATGAISWQTPPIAWLTATAYSATAPASVVVQGGETYVCAISHTSGTFATDLAASRWIKAAQKGADGISATNSTYGQCVLSKVSTDLKLVPKNGNLLTVNGVACTVPDAGVILAATSATPGTLYYIYATASAGAVNALERSTTGPAVSTTSGNKGTVIKTGDNTRTLVGMARAITGPAWVDSGNQRFVRSWFNDQGVSLTGTSTLTGTSGSSLTEVNTAARAEFISWSGDSIDISALGTMTNAGSASSQSAAVGIDGTGVTSQPVAANNYTASARCCFSARYTSNGLAEGYHFATPLLRSIGGGTATFNTDSGAAIVGTVKR